MNLKLIKLYDQLSKYEEAVELRKIIAANSYPMLLKIAQEQLQLFQMEKETEEEEALPKEPVKITFSFNTMIGNKNLSQDGAKFLDSVLEKMSEERPEATEDQLVSELKSEFFTAPNYGYGYYDWFYINSENIKKYLNKYPDLKWKPEDHQLQLPLKELPSKIPLGGTEEQVRLKEKEKEDYYRIKKEITSKEEYRILRKPYYELSSEERIEVRELQQKMNAELKAAFAEAGIKESALYHDDYKNQDFTHSADKIQKLKEEIEEKWHRLKERDAFLKSEIDLLDPGDFEPRPVESIKTYQDFVIGITEYTTWAAKEFIANSINYRPIFEKSWRHPRPVNEYDISDLTKTLELSTLSVDPLEDFHSKNSYLSREMSYCESIISNIIVWKSLFKKINKNLLKEVTKSIDSLDAKSKRTLKWVERFKPEVVKENYVLYLSKIASNFSQESRKFPPNFEQVAIGKISDLKALDFFSLFLHKKNQSDLFKDLVKVLSKDSLASVGSIIITDITNKIRTHLFSLMKIKFEERYFEIGTVIVDGDRRTNWDAKKPTIEQIKNFIRDWNGKPNLKSYENVILSLTKDQSAVDDFYKVQIPDDLEIRVDGYDYYFLDNDITNFISKLKVSDEEEILKKAEEELLEKYESLIIKGIAERISGVLSKNSSRTYYGEPSIQRGDFDKIAPVITSSEFRNLNITSLRLNSVQSIVSHIMTVMRVYTSHLKDYVYFKINFSKREEFNQKLSKLESNFYNTKEDKADYLDTLQSSIRELINLASILLTEDVDDDLKKSIELRLPIYNTCLTAAIEVKNIDKLIKFLSASEDVSKAFGGVGFKDISSGVDDLFSLLNLKSASKKEFIQLISTYVSSGYSGKTLDPKDKVLITSFLSTKTNGKAGHISRIINALGLRDTKQILSTIEYSNKKFTYVNLSVEDLDKAIRSLQLGVMNPEAAAERWLNAAAFIHNHSTIPMNYIKRLLNSPNFLSNTTISKEFIETCTSLYLAGGINGLKNPATTSGGVVVKLIESGLILDKNEFFRVLNSFSRLCANKSGVRPNIGAGTPSMILDDYLEDNKLDYIKSDVPSWESLSFDEKILKIKEKLKAETYALLTEDEANSAIEEFENKIKKIIENSVTEEQYNQDMRIKTLIQSASAKLKLVKSSEALIRYAKDAKKKDERLFDFQWESSQSPFRFRVLKNLDPYHFEVGADTNCCQRLNGVGEGAAIDSFINPLAGVLVLEGKVYGEWKTLSQSYFHFVPKSNGIILDNVEHSYSNLSRFKEKTPFDIDQAYAAFAAYIKEKNNLSYVRCGTEYNKLTNASFSKGSISGGDPRYFEHNRKYTDFSSSSHIDLLKPKFKLTMTLEDKKAMSIYSKLIKLSYDLNKEERLEIFDLCFA